MTFVVVLPATTVRADDATHAEQFLLERGLAASGKLWTCAEDRALASRMDSLRELVRKLNECEAKIKRRIARNEALAAELSQLEKQMERARQGNHLFGDSNYERLNERRNKVLEQYLPEPRFSRHPDTRTELIELIGHRQQLTLLLLEIPNTIFEVAKAYDDLKNDPAVIAALSQLGKGHRLNSRNLMTRYEGRLLRAEKVARGDWIPLYREQGTFRIPVMINDRRPATLNYKDGEEPCLLPDRVRRKAGITIDTAAPESTYRTEDGREFKVRGVVMPYLRLGPHLIENVAFLALPPEADDLAGRLTQAAFTDYEVQARPERLRLQIAPAN